ncbi:MAG: hypothetical protein LBU79_05330 [Planctomycetota bacterium]|jgi:hypothetical protein|nr:hypothetical protein [Planctomycetota bacterium]
MDNTLYVLPGKTQLDSQPGRTDDELSAAVNGYLSALLRLRSGIAGAEAEGKPFLTILESRFGSNLKSIVEANLSRHHDHPDFANDERLFIDLGLMDVRFVGNDDLTPLLDELKTTRFPSVFFLSEWLSQRHQTLQVESSINEMPGAKKKEEQETASMKTRRRLLGTLAEYFDRLPGIPSDVLQSIRTGKFDDSLLSFSINLMKNHNRQLLLRRRNLWQFREQVMAKAKARANDNPTTLRLFDALNQLYARDWNERYIMYSLEHSQSKFGEEDEGETESHDNTPPLSLSGLLLLDVKQVNLASILAARVNGDASPDFILHSAETPRLAKADISRLKTLFTTFDRSLGEFPPIVIVPGSGRGIYVWESDYILLFLRPAVNVDDSMATALAFQRMINDCLKNDNALKKAYTEAFPEAVFRNDFPVDYRAWFCRLSHGDISAMSQGRRDFFRFHIGPDITGPMLPANLREVGPQTRDIICRRLEKQIASGEKDYRIHSRLAAIYWYNGNLEAAGVQYNTATIMAPNDGETLFTAGMFMRAADSSKGADTFFRQGAEKANNSLWGIYCQDALDGRF